MIFEVVFLDNRNQRRAIDAARLKRVQTETIYTVVVLVPVVEKGKGPDMKAHKFAFFSGG